MATVNKDFKIKSGLIVEGSSATVGGYDILTKKQGDQDYIVSLIGGTATSANEANKVVKRDANGNFAAGEITANLVGDVDGTVSSISNHSTTDLSEGANLYFTNQRALDATNAAYDAIGSANTAQANAEGYADDLMSAEVIARNSAIATAKSEAGTYAEGLVATEAQDRYTAITNAINTEVTDRNSAISSAISTEVSDRNSAITSAINTEVTDRNSAIATAKSQAIQDSKDYTDAEVAALVDQAPALLDTLNELAAAIADNPNYATDAANAVAGRVAKSGDTMTGDLTLPGAPTLNLHAATKGYVDGEITTALSTAQGYADSAETDAVATANSYTNGEITSALTTAQGYATTAEDNAKAFATSEAQDAYTNAVAAAAIDATDKANAAEAAAILHADNLTTDDVAEGSAQYFTDVRAKTSAAALIVGATKTNITITGDENGLVISAENGIADSDTDDLVEGSSNLYFTNARAQDALEGTTPTFAAVNIDNVAKQVASQLTASTAGVQTAHAWAKADYRSAEFLVKVAYGDHTEVSKVLVTLDVNDNIAMTEYGVVGTNGSASSISANISGNNVQLQVTTTNNNSTVTVVGTLLA